MISIAILLATYNSEDYLVELLDSITNQSYADWILFIRDDGSKDNTLNIINRYVKKNSKIVLLSDAVKGRGAKNSFMYLLNAVEANYYMFCDHDDVWLPEKIKKTYHKMVDVEKVSPTSSPIIIHTDLIVVNENLKVISHSFWKYSNIDPSYNSFNYYSAYNNITGCTMMINNKVKAISLNVYPDAPMHDAWLAMVVSFNRGVIDYVREPLILYRQHEKNVIGAHKAPGFIERLLNLQKVFNANKRLFATVNFLNKTSYIYFICNKIYYLLENKKHT